MNRDALTRIAVTVLLALAPEVRSEYIHHNRRQTAYYNVHEVCVKELKAARKAARSHDGEERRKLEEAAKQEYRRCQDHAYWAFYHWGEPNAVDPNYPPKDAAAPPKTTTSPELPRTSTELRCTFAPSFAS